MAVHIRLSRHGTKKLPFYRIVVTDHRSRRDGRFIENIGTFLPSPNPGNLVVDKERLSYWQKQGALASHTLSRLLKKHSAPAAAPTAG
jgi:small subunit ribosomal protein S16